MKYYCTNCQAHKPAKIENQVKNAYMCPECSTFLTPEPEENPRRSGPSLGGDRVETNAYNQMNEECESKGILERLKTRLGL